MSIRKKHRNQSLINYKPVYSKTKLFIQHTNIVVIILRKYNGLQVIVCNIRTQYTQLIGTSLVTNKTIYTQLTKNIIFLKLMIILNIGSKRNCIKNNAVSET